MYHLDAEQVFIFSELNEEMFMRLLLGWLNKFKNMMFLNEFLYRLKEAGRACNTLPNKHLEEQGFESYLADLCSFPMMVDEDVRISLVLHIDYLIVAGAVKDCKDFRNSFGKCFPNESLRELRWYTRCFFNRNITKGT